MDKIKDTIWKKNEDSLQSFNDTVLVLTHKESNHWNMFPVIPPIRFLKKDLQHLQNTTIIEEEIDDFSHFDILDRPWANALNKVVPISILFRVHRLSNCGDLLLTISCTSQFS